MLKAWPSSCAVAKDARGRRARSADVNVDMVAVFDDLAYGNLVQNSID